MIYDPNLPPQLANDSTFNNEKEIKPIIKFNGGRGAILCNKCSVIIKSGLTKEEVRGKTDLLYCYQCLKHVKNG